LQASLGIADSANLLREDLIATSFGRAKTDLIDTYCNLQHELFEWFEEQGIHFSAVELSSGQSVARSHRTDAVSMLAKLRQRAEAPGDSMCSLLFRATLHLRHNAGYHTEQPNQADG